MDKNPLDLQELSLLLNFKECKCLYRKLKPEESKLRDDELSILQRIEKMLYSRLSIREIEEISALRN
ncbi:MAG: hypothetical protein LBI14_02615 [Treponema sp.]|jgi:hypothetical protein|nr:hypothetical protein [Treponema sp.]